MALPVYIKAEKFVQRIIEIEELFSKLPHDSKERKRSYRIENKYVNSIMVKYPNAYVLKNLYRSSKSTIPFNHLAKSGGGLAVEIDEPVLEMFSTKNNSEENDFQLSLIMDSYEILKGYITAKLQEYYKSTQRRNFYFSTLDTISYTNALKAFREIMNERKIR